MPLAFFTVMFILFEVHALLNYKEIQRVEKLTDEKEKQEWIKKHWLYVFASTSYITYCFYLIFTPFWVISTLMFIMSYFVMIVKNKQPNIYLPAKIIDTVIGITLLSWILKELIVN